MPGPRFQHLAADGLYNVLHPIEEGVVVEVAEGPGVHPNRRAIIVYPIVKILHVETVFDEFGAPAVQIVRVEKHHYGEHFGQHVFGILGWRRERKLSAVVADVRSITQHLCIGSSLARVVDGECIYTPQTFSSCHRRNQSRLARRLISLSQLAKPMELQRGRTGWE